MERKVEDAGVGGKVKVDLGDEGGWEVEEKETALRRKRGQEEEVEIAERYRERRENSEEGERR